MESTGEEYKMQIIQFADLDIQFECIKKGGKLSSHVTFIHFTTSGQASLFILAKADQNQ